MAGDFTEPWSEDEAMDEDENGFVLAVVDVVQLKECGEAEKGREQSGIGCRAELNCAY